MRLEGGFNVGVVWGREMGNKGRGLCSLCLFNIREIVVFLWKFFWQVLEGYRSLERDLYRGVYGPSVDAWLRMVEVCWVSFFLIS